MAVQLTDGTNNALVDATSKGQVVQNPQVASQAGYTGLVSRSEPGAAGSARVHTIQGTQNNRIMIGNTQYLWDDTFNSLAQNTSKYNFQAHTVAQTAAQSGGFLILNNSGLTTANSGCAIRTFRSFPLTGNSEVRVIFSGGFASATAPVAHAIIEFGLFTATLGGAPVAPLDGMLFRYNAVGELRGVISYNGTETQTAAITQPALNVNHDFMIIVGTDAVSFWIDREFRAAITLVTDSPTQGQPCSEASQPITIRSYVDGSGTASAVKTQISDVFVTMVGPDTTRTWNTAKAGFGHMAYQGQNGGTMGTTANALNAATPAASALTNTAISTGSPVGLGGVAHILPTLAAGTDGIVFSYQNPVGSVTQTPRDLIVTGVWLQSVVDVTLTGGPLALAYSVAYGHTAISMATAEAASFAAGGTTKAPRRVWIGTEACLAAAAAGTSLGNGIYRQFASPIVVAPGEFIAITVRNQGTVTTVGSIVTTAGFDAFNE